MKKYMLRIACLTIIGIFMGSMTGCVSAPESVPLPSTPDLVIYTAREEAVYEPIIKEFQERTGLLVQVDTGSSEELLRLLEGKKTAPKWDILFGVGIETLENAKTYLEPYESPELAFISDSFLSEDHYWTSFSALPLVIIYNTNVVTYRELPTGWGSLLEPRWQGRIAFVDPSISDTYSAALVTAVQTSLRSTDYVPAFMENINYGTLSTLADVNSAVTDGRYSLGVTLEEYAQALRSSGADIDYIYPEEGTTALPDGTAILANCLHPEQARQFLDFTISKDTQRILVSNLNRRSVRMDVEPPAGLPAIDRLVLKAIDLPRFTQDKISILKGWNSLIQLQERRRTP